MLPLAPALLSMTKVVFRRVCSSSASTRAIVSPVPLPPGAGTMTWIVLPGCGQSWASADRRHRRSGVGERRGDETSRHRVNLVRWWVRYLGMTDMPASPARSAEPSHSTIAAFTLVGDSQKPNRSPAVAPPAQRSRPSAQTRASAPNGELMRMDRPGSITTKQLAKAFWPLIAISPPRIQSSTQSLACQAGTSVSGAASTATGDG